MRLGNSETYTIKFINHARIRWTDVTSNAEACEKKNRSHKSVHGCLQARTCHVSLSFTPFFFFCCVGCLRESEENRSIHCFNHHSYERQQGSTYTS